jgi:hypothetical protein
MGTAKTPYTMTLEELRAEVKAAADEAWDALGPGHMAHPADEEASIGRLTSSGTRDELVGMIMWLRGVVFGAGLMKVRRDRDADDLDSALREFAPPGAVVLGIM